MTLMRKAEKIIEKFKRSNKGQKFEDCAKVLEFLGYKMKPGKGDHFKFTKDQNMIVIARHRPVAPGAVNDVIEAWGKEND